MLLPIAAALVAAAPAVGAKAPAFSVDTTDGRKATLADYRGKTLVLAFFPKAFTGG